MSRLTKSSREMRLGLGGGGSGGTNQMREEGLSSLLIVAGAGYYGIICPGLKRGSVGPAPHQLLHIYGSWIKQDLERGTGPREPCYFGLPQLSPQLGSVPLA
jgi:hypothetical protein